MLCYDMLGQPTTSADCRMTRLTDRNISEKEIFVITSLCKFYLIMNSTYGLSAENVCRVSAFLIHGPTLSAEIIGPQHMSDDNFNQQVGPYGAALQWRRELWGTCPLSTSKSESESQLFKYCVVCEIS